MHDAGILECFAAVCRGVSQAPIGTGGNCSDTHDRLHSIQLQRLSGARLLQLPFIMSGEAAVMTFGQDVHDSGKPCRGLDSTTRKWSIR